MIRKVLTNCLKPIIVAEAKLRNRAVVTSVLFAGAAGALGLLALAIIGAWWSWWAVVGLLGFLFVLAGAGFIRSSKKGSDLQELARQVEEEHPDLRALLLTAMSQEPDEDGNLSYLQSRVLSDVTEHAVKNQWVRRVSTKRLRRAGFWQVAALIAFSSSFLFLLDQAPTRNAKLVIGESEPEPQTVINVTPGDVDVEKGTRLVVEVVFTGPTPAAAVLVVLDPGKKGAERGRIPMNPGLDEAAFSALIAKVDSDAVYRIDFDEQHSDSYSITTFEFPKLEQADATITPPRYVEKEPRLIEDTRKISLMEGSNLEWKLKINKPTAAAELFGEDESVIPLKASKSDPNVLIAAHQPDKSQKYRLHLVDNEDRVNKRPPWFSVTVKKNLPPKLDFIFPKRDVDVSAIQELPVEAKVWDDVAVLKAGVIFQFGDTEKDIVIIDSKKPGGKHHMMETLYAVEKLGAKPRDLISYHLWAEDIGPDGKSRRILSDLFLAEVRHFEDIFKQGQSGGGSPSEEKGQTQKLLKLQKDLLNASWKVLRLNQLGRSVDELESSINVMLQSQQIAIDQTMAAIEKVEDADLKSILNSAKEEMSKAVENFQLVLKKTKGKSLSDSHHFVRKAYEKLIQARAREHSVTKQKPSKSEQPQEKEAQLMNLEMKQRALQYKEESEAGEEKKTVEQQENLEVLNKLKELARRQEAIAEKIKELETALHEAETEEGKREIERQLKRLQEEQEQLLRDTDDLLEKMDSEQNRANMAEERERLEEVRESIREASEKLKEEKLASATNAATRAKRELDEAKEGFRKKTSRQFSDEMKNIRNAARELAENQKAISEKLEDGEGEKREGDPFSQGSSPLENMKLSQDIEEQNSKLEAMLEEMKTLSEESETSEPLLSEALYESVRSAIVNGVTDSLEEARDFTRYNQRSRARIPEQAAARGIEELGEKIESAAEKILGSEVDSLRLARSEVDKLIEQAKEEEERLGRQKGGEKAGTKQGKAGDPTGLGEGEKGGGDGEILTNSATEDGGESKGDGVAELVRVSPTGSSGKQQSSHSSNSLGGPSMFFNQAEESRQSGPITGDDFKEWADRLGNVEEMVDQEDLRNNIARVLDDARAMRIDFKRDNLPPAVGAIQKRITDPLVELRARLSEELAKLNKENPLAPIDRDPVPGEFRDLVRRYYENLGKGE